jgi:hypothetical protein
MSSITSMVALAKERASQLALNIFMGAKAKRKQGAMTCLVRRYPKISDNTQWEYLSAVK